MSLTRPGVPTTMWGWASRDLMSTAMFVPPIQAWQSTWDTFVQIKIIGETCISEWQLGWMMNRLPGNHTSLEIFNSKRSIFNLFEIKNSKAILPRDNHRGHRWLSGSAVPTLWLGQGQVPESPADWSQFSAWGRWRRLRSFQFQTGLGQSHLLPLHRGQ